jgi:uncharacterized protein VirK/YbjX
MPVGKASAFIRKIPLSNIIVGLAPPGYEFNSLNVLCPGYLVALEKALSSTPREILQAYFIHQTINVLYIRTGFNRTRFSASRRAWNMTDQVRLVELPPWLPIS